MGAASLQNCAEICAHDERCIAASFSGGAGPGHCYLKNRTGDLSPNDGVDGELENTWKLKLN